MRVSATPLAAAVNIWREYRDLPHAVHWLCLGTLVNRSGMFLIVFLTLYVRELGYGPAVATRAVGAWGLGTILASLAGGQLADRFGRRVVMLGSLVGGAAILTVFGQLRDPWAIAAAVFLFGLSTDMYRPAAAAMIADLVEPARRTEAFGLMYVAINLGFTVAATLGGVISRYSFQWLFWGDALTTCAYALLILVVIRETLPHHESGPDAEPSVPATRAVQLIARDRVFLTYCLATLLAITVFTQIMSSLPLQLQAHGIGSDTYGLIIAVNGVIIVLFQVPVAAVITRFDRGRVLGLAALLTGIGIGAVGLSSVVWHFVLVIVIVTVGEVMQAPLSQAVVSDLAPTALRGRYMGVVALMFGIALTMGAPLGGWVLEHLGSSTLWSGCFVLGSIAALLFLSLRRAIAVSDVSD